MYYKMYRNTKFRVIQTTGSHNVKKLIYCMERSNSTTDIKQKINQAFKAVVGKIFFPRSQQETFRHIS